jgi:hypothetical protein
MASNAILRWNGEALDATYVNSRKMTVLIPAAMIATEGSATITVFNPQGCGESAGKTFVYSYPRPLLKKLDPSSAAQNTPPFILNLSGKNFVPESRVWWTMGDTATELPATYVSSTQLQVQLTEAMPAKSGTAKIQVETQGSKTLKSAKFNFKIK